ncbi:lysosomal thioesterase PPT2-B-like isoform X2 [Clytia hemisphaerica]|uniref:palmitoyl-CoA hydrolase n=1 Tax=Clytia hemisphaerica TaxID=252671 RepID=A0A7M5V4V8_9CNID
MFVVELTLILLGIFHTNYFAHGYQTVVTVHGIDSDEGSFDPMVRHIKDVHPGTRVVNLPYSPNQYTLDPLSVQLISFRRAIEKVLDDLVGNFHLICHSQGGVVCMGYLMLTKNHRVDNFVVLSSPIFGQYGLTGDILNDIPALRPFKDLAAEAITELVYTPLLQNSLSIANYWRDPRPSTKEAYEKVAVYLPLIHNDPQYHLYNETEAIQRKANFLDLKNLVLFGGPTDEIIKPWQSPLFGYFDEDPLSGHVVNMTDQKIYKEDWIGLQALHKTGRLHSYVVPGLYHEDWVNSESFFMNYVAQWLT